LTKNKIYITLLEVYVNYILEERISMRHSAAIKKLLNSNPSEIEALFMFNREIIISNALRKIIAVHCHEVTVLCKKGLYQLIVEGTEIVSSKNLAAVLRPLDNKDLAKSVQKVFALDTPEPSNLGSILRAFDVTHQ